MPASKGMSRRIKDALVTILQGLTYDAGGGPETAFVSVLDNTHDDFEGYPSARVLPNLLTSITGMNSQKDHTVSFAVIMTWPLEDPSNVESALYNQMLDYTDIVTNAMEHDDYVGTLSTIDSNIQSWMMNVKNASWTTGQGKLGSLLMCVVNIEITYSIDVF